MKFLQLAGFALAFATGLASGQDSTGTVTAAGGQNQNTLQQRPKVEHFDPEYVDVPGLYEMYGMKYDLNHAMRPDINFMMEQVIDPETSSYRTESIMADPETGKVPNWFIMFVMKDCYYCEAIAPQFDELARNLHKGMGEKANYRTAIFDCSAEENLFMCQYLHISRLPKFMVLRPGTTNRFYQFPLAYRKNFNNLYRFAVREWPQAYTQHSFVVPNDSTEWDDWKFYFFTTYQDMLEECAGFFLEWGFYWIGYYQMVAMAIFMLVGPFLMMYQTYRTYLWYKQQQSADANKAVEEDDDFERDDSVAPEAVPAEETKTESTAAEAADKKND